jgi:hypothetical protein
MVHKVFSAISSKSFSVVTRIPKFFLPDQVSIVIWTAENANEQTRVLSQIRTRINGDVLGHIDNHAFLEDS